MLSTIKRSLPLQLLTAAILAWFFATIMPAVANITEPVTEQAWYQLILLGKTTYIGLLKMVIGLVVMLSLMQGITNIGSTLKLKTLGVSTMIFYSLTSIIAISLGLGAALLMPEWQPLVEPVTVADHISLIEQDTVTGSSITAKLLAMSLVNPF